MEDSERILTAEELIEKLMKKNSDLTESVNELSTSVRKLTETLERESKKRTRTNKKLDNINSELKEHSKALEILTNIVNGGEYMVSLEQRERILEAFRKGINEGLKDYKFEKEIKDYYNVEIENAAQNTATGAMGVVDKTPSDKVDVVMEDQAKDAWDKGIMFTTLLKEKYKELKEQEYFENEQEEETIANVENVAIAVAEGKSDISDEIEESKEEIKEIIEQNNEELTEKLDEIANEITESKEEKEVSATDIPVPSEEKSEEEYQNDFDAYLAKEVKKLDESKPKNDFVIPAFLRERKAPVPPVEPTNRVSLQPNIAREITADEMKKVAKDVEIIKKDIEDIKAEQQYSNGKVEDGIKRANRKGIVIIVIGAITLAVALFSCSKKKCACPQEPTRVEGNVTPGELNPTEDVTPVVTNTPVPTNTVTPTPGLFLAPDGCYYESEEQYKEWVNGQVVETEYFDGEEINGAWVVAGNKYCCEKAYIDWLEKDIVECFTKDENGVRYPVYKEGYESELEETLRQADILKGKALNKTK